MFNGMNAAPPRPARPACRRSQQHGFTLIEMAVVVAIIGVVATIAVSADPEDQASSEGFADQLVADMDQVRLRSMASRRWHRLTFTAGSGTLDEATTVGMTAPVAWDTIGVIHPPKRIMIDSLLDGTQVDPTGSSAGTGEGLELEVLFAPDGTGNARTIFISDVRGRSRARVAIFGATGLARAYSGW
jgi:prepilin-type N-terminal cleavage/methylation domain-containing protein